MPSLGTGRSVSFRVEETSTLTATAPALLGTGTAPVVGAWGLAGLDLLYVPWARTRRHLPTADYSSYHQLRRDGR
jgi:hypothetical protein